MSLLAELIKKENERIEIAQDTPREKCGRCGNEIDADVCWCGDPMENHASPMQCGHSPVSMGCTCFYHKEPMVLPPRHVLHVNCRCAPPQGTIFAEADYD